LPDQCCMPVPAAAAEAAVLAAEAVVRQAAEEALAQLAGRAVMLAAGLLLVHAI